MNPYQVLGVSPSASLDECKKAMRKLARQYHPDLGGDAEKFCQVNEAYKMIANGKYKPAYIKRKRKCCVFENKLFEFKIIEVQLKIGNLYLYIIKLILKGLIENG